MVKKGDFVWLITMRFHPLWFVDNNQVLILINLLNEVRIAPKGFLFRDNLPCQTLTGKYLQDLPSRSSELLSD